MRRFVFSSLLILCALSVQAQARDTADDVLDGGNVILSSVERRIQNPFDLRKSGGFQKEIRAAKQLVSLAKGNCSNLYVKFANDVLSICNQAQDYADELVAGKDDYALKKHVLDMIRIYKRE